LGALDHQCRHAIGKAERREPPRKVRTSELPAHDGIEHVSGEAALSVARHPRAQQLEGDDRDGLMQGQTVEVRQRTAVLDCHEPRLRDAYGTRRA